MFLFEENRPAIPILGWHKLLKRYGLVGESLVKALFFRYNNIPAIPFTKGTGLAVPYHMLFSNKLNI